MANNFGNVKNPASLFGMGLALTVSVAGRVYSTPKTTITHKKAFLIILSAFLPVSRIHLFAAREITAGKGEGCYGPEDKLTRGQFLVMMMRAYDIAPDEIPADNFIDAGNTYYTGYLSAAKRLGISRGVGDNRYAPEKEITRQEVFTLLYNVLQVLNELPQETTGRRLTDFSDAEEVASWAEAPLEVLVKSGVVTGSDRQISPTKITNRVQMAQVLYSLLTR